MQSGFVAIMSVINSMRSSCSPPYVRRPLPPPGLVGLRLPISAGHEPCDPSRVVDEQRPAAPMTDEPSHRYAVTIHDRVGGGRMTAYADRLSDIDVAIRFDIYRAYNDPRVTVVNPNE